MKASEASPQRYLLPTLAFAIVGIVVAVCLFSWLAASETAPGMPLMMAALKVFDPFLRFPAAGHTIFILSFAFNGLYYLGVGVVSRRALRQRWRVFLKIIVIGAAAGVLNISMQAIFAVCEYVLTGRLFAT
jgi:hypothetical protein